MAIKRQPLTPDELEAASNLKRVWNAKKAELGLTQESAAHQLGYKTQSAVNQYLNAKVKLNLSAILSFAKLLKVSPAEISTKLVPAEFLPEGTVGMSVNEAISPPYTPSKLLSKLHGKATPKTKKALEELIEIDERHGLSEHDIAILNAIIARYES